MNLLLGYTYTYNTSSLLIVIYTYKYNTYMPYKVI